MNEKVTNIDYQELKKLKREFQRAGVTDFVGVSAAVEQALEESEEKPSDYILESLGDILDYVGENIERLALEREIESRTAEEWRRLEYEHVIKSEFTEPDLRDMVLTAVEKGKITEEESHKVYDKYKSCKHRFCLNYFMPSHGRQVYCSDSCKEGEKYAVREFERTSKLYENGTYLPVYAYKEIRDKQEIENYQEHERLFSSDVLQRIAGNKELEKYEKNMPNTTTTKLNKFRRDKKALIDQETKHAEAKKPGEVESYNIFDLSPEEIKEKGLEKTLQTLILRG